MLTKHFYIGLASLLKGEKAVVQNFYIAVGAGEPAWDQMLPEFQRDTRRLVNEIARRAVPPEEVTFLDSEGKATEVPTPRLRIRAILGFNEGVGTLRECGLFAGEATAAKDSGTLLSYYVHPRIEKTAEMTLERNLLIDLTPKPYAPGSRVTRYLGNSDSEEFHDLENLKPGCQVNEIRFDRRVYFASPDPAIAAGYDYCAFCFGRELSRR